MTSRTPPKGDRVQPTAPGLPAILPRGGALCGAIGVYLMTVGAGLPTVATAAPVTTAASALSATVETALIQVQAPADQKPRINVGKVILVEPASETPMPIQVGPLDAIPRNSFVRLRGLPGPAVLSEGHSIAPGAWAIPLAVLPNLRVSLPVGLTGKSDITIALVQIDGTVLAEARASLLIAAASMVAPEREVAPRERSVASVGPAQSPLEATPPPAVKPPVPPAGSQRNEPPQLTEDQKRATAFITRGRTLAESGNISAARLFYRRAADAGLAEGALALAGTYDPVELSRMRVAGVQPDIALAREWYQKARDLGAPEADERLRQLGSR